MNRVQAFLLLQSRFLVLRAASGQSLYVLPAACDTYHCTPRTSIRDAPYPAAADMVAKTQHATCISFKLTGRGSIWREIPSS